VQREVTSEENSDQPTEEDIIVEPQDSEALYNVFLLFEGKEVGATDMVQPKGSGAGPEQSSPPAHLNTIEVIVSFYSSFYFEAPHNSSSGNSSGGQPTKCWNKYR